MQANGWLQRRWRRFLWTCWILVAVTWSSVALATPPSTPISLELELMDTPALHEWADLTVEVQSIFNAPNTHVELVLPEGGSAQTASWVVDLQANLPITLTTQVVFQKEGNLMVSARALKALSADEVWGDMKTLTLHLSPAGVSMMSWQVEQVPVALLLEPGDTDPVSLEPTPFSFRAQAQVALSPTEVPRAQPLPRPMSAPAPVNNPGTVTLTGRWNYDDRSNVERNIDQQLIEIRRGDGSALSPRAFCFTAVDGTFSCPTTHPGTTMRVWVWSWMNFNIPGGGTNRLGVFSGPEVAGGCGSDAIDCAYPVQTGEISCADGATCDIGTWIVETTASGEPWLGAHQMTQDLIRSWKKLLFDPRHPADTVAGPGRINYPVPAGHGTHAHVGSGEVDGWISIEPPNQQSADIVNHEYGHVVMSNLWTGFSPKWPTFDCPSPHFINTISGSGCALSEGFADFWAWYSNTFYDGDNSTANDGPIFNWPGGASTNMETRDGGTYQNGDQVEGNIAAALGDLYDTANDGPVTGDQLSDGIQHIWHVVYSQSDFNFAEWWSAYWSTFGHNACPALNILRFNTIQYTTPSSCLAPAIDVQPPSWNYGNVNVNTTSTKDFTVQNTGTNTLNVTSTTLVGANAGEFAITNGGGAFSLAPNAIRIVSVRFAPTSAGAKTAILRIASNASNAPTKDVPLSGTGMVVNQPMLTVSPTSVERGSAVTATWANITSPTATDWLGLYTPGAGDTAFLAWRYTTGTASGNVPFTIPGTLAPGTYQLRLFRNDGFTHLATSNSFTVTGGGGGVTLTVSPTSVERGSAVTATWANITSPTATDWLGLYTPGASDTAFLAWRYTTGTASGNVPFTIPGTLAPGTYELRLFRNDGFTRLAISNSFTVTGVVVDPTLTVSPTSVERGNTVTATWANIASPTATDWLGLYTPGAGDTAFLAWRYTTGTASGNVPFTIPSTITPGTYELRLFRNNSFTRLAISNSFTVTGGPTLTVSPTTVVRGGTVTATWANIASPTATDWLGLYTPGASDTAFLAWRYTTGTASGNVPFTIPGTLAPGTYQLRLFRNDGFTRLATSNSFTVTSSSGGLVLGPAATEAQ